MRRHFTVCYGWFSGLRSRHCRSGKTNSTLDVMVLIGVATREVYLLESGRSCSISGLQARRSTLFYGGLTGPNGYLHDAASTVCSGWSSDSSRRVIVRGAASGFFGCVAS
jgi:hypothetical protein